MSTGMVLPSIPSTDVLGALDKYFDKLSAAPSNASTKQLRASCALLIIHEHGCRARELAWIEIADVRVLGTGAVECRVPLYSERWDSSIKIGFVRNRVKREWCPILIEYLKSCPMPARRGIPVGSLFGATAQEITTMVANLIQKITGENWNARNLRRAVARRVWLNDGGRSPLIWHAD